MMHPREVDWLTLPAADYWQAKVDQVAWAVAHPRPAARLTRPATPQPRPAPAADACSNCRKHGVRRPGAVRRSASGAWRCNACGIRHAATDAMRRAFLSR